MAVLGQPRHDDVVTAFEEIVCEALELRGTRAETVQQQDRTLLASAVDIGKRPPRGGNARMVPGDESLE